MQFNADELKGKQAPSLQGNLTAEEALRKLLEGSGFIFTNTGKGSYIVQKQALGPIRRQSVAGGPCDC